MLKLKRYLAGLLCAVTLCNSINLTGITVLADDLSFEGQGEVSNEIAVTELATASETDEAHATTDAPDGEPSVWGTPYRTVDGTEQYDVTVPHVVIHQVYGVKSGANVSHAFIELYNPTSQDVDLSTWSLQYRSSQEGEQNDSWTMRDLTGTVKSHHSYLVRCGSTSKPADGYLELTEFDEEWDLQIYNKGISVVLLTSQTQIDADAPVFDNELKEPVIDGYVDMFAVSGNDGKDSQEALYYETAASAVQSKKKTVRRVAFRDTDNNSVEGDFEEVDYSFANVDYITWIAPRSGNDGAWDAESNPRPTFTVAYEYNGGTASAGELQHTYELGTAVTEPDEPTRAGGGTASQAGMRTKHLP